MLITTRLDYEDKFQGSKCHKTLWNEIKEVLCSAGYIVNTEQCINKFKEAKRAWRAALDNNKKTGSSPKSTPYDDIFDETYGTRAGATPVFTLSGGLGEERAADVSDESSCSVNSVKSEASPASASYVKTKKKIRKRTLAAADSDDRTLEWLKAYEEKQSRFREEQLSVAKEMHVQKLNMMERLLNAMGKKD